MEEEGNHCYKSIDLTEIEVLSNWANGFLQYRDCDKPLDETINIVLEG
ncbi:unnamed protein product [Urochloa humidicola]